MDAILSFLFGKSDSDTAKITFDSFLFNPPDDFTNIQKYYSIFYQKIWDNPNILNSFNYWTTYKIPFDLKLFILLFLNNKVRTPNSDSEKVNQDMCDKVINFIQDIRVNYNDIYTMYCINNENNNTKENFSHGLIQCSNTIHILSDLMKLKNVSPTTANKDLFYNVNNIIINRYVMRGTLPTYKGVGNHFNIPDHDFILMVIGKKYYILQSYYYAYTVNGYNGFKELTFDEYLYVHRLIFIFYQYYLKYSTSTNRNVETDEEKALTSTSSPKPLTEDEIQYLQKLKCQFEWYTGIDSNKHEADTDDKETFLFEFRIKIIPAKDIDLYITNIKNGICQKSEKTLKYLRENENEDNKTTIKIKFDYFFYNAFILFKNHDCDTKYSVSLYDYNSFKVFTGMNINEAIYNQLEKTDIKFEFQMEIKINIAKQICKFLSKTFECRNDLCAFKP
jgi:hypothetical protein